MLTVWMQIIVQRQLPDHRVFQDTAFVAQSTAEEHPLILQDSGFGRKPLPKDKRGKVCSDALRVIIL